MTLAIISGGEDILTRQNDGDDFDDLNNTLKKDFQNRMNEAEQASKAAAARSQVRKIALDKNHAIDEGASDCLKRNYLQDRTKKDKSSKGKRRTNVVGGDMSHAEDKLKVLVMDVTTSGERHTLDDIENAIAEMASSDDTISKKDLNKALTSVGIDISKQSLDTLFFALRSLP